MNAETIQLQKKEMLTKSLKDDVLLQLERGLENIKSGKVSEFTPSTKKR